MATVTQFPSFKTSYKRLKENKYRSFLVEFYHYDNRSEPTLSIFSLVSEITIYEIDNEKLIGIRFVGGTDLTFRESIYNSNLSNDDVVFSSKFDDETYCIISFSEME